MAAILDRLNRRDQQLQRTEAEAVADAWQVAHAIALAAIDGTAAPDDDDLLAVFDAAGWNAATVQANIVTARNVITSRRVISQSDATEIYRTVSRSLNTSLLDGERIKAALSRYDQKPEGTRRQLSTRANAATNHARLPQGYQLTSEQAKQLASHPRATRVRELREQVIPECQKLAAGAAADLAAAVENTTKIVAFIDQLTAERNLTMAEAELSALQKLDS